MSPHELRRIKAIFDLALDCPPGERPAYVKQACRGDVELEIRVNEFLRLNDRQGAFVDSTLPELLHLDVPPDEPAPELPAGLLLHERYRIESLLERSPNSVIYSAKDKRLFGKPVIAKVVRGAGGRSLLEPRALSALSHPSVAGILDYGELENGDLFVVLEYLEGVSLRSVLRSGRMDWRRMLRCTRQLATVLASVHEAGIWHLDLKPENVIITDAGVPEERLSLLDFGIARVAGDEHEVFGGSPGYMPPEQAEGHPLAVSDIYALGALMFEMLAGTLPESGVDVEQALAAVRPPVPRAIRRVIGRAMSADPKARFGSFADLIEALVEPGTGHRFGAVAAISAALATLLALIWLPRGGDTRRVDPISVDIPASAGRPYWLTLSPDAGKLYFAAGSYFFEYMDIYAKDLATGVTSALTNDGKFKIAPVCSPDGKRIVFLRDRGFDVATAVEMPITGGSERELFTGYATQCTWSPDSTALIVSMRAGKEMWPHLRGFNLRTSEWWEITAPPEQGRGDSFGVVSPNGATLAFVRKESRESSDIYLLTLNHQLRSVGNGRRLTSLRSRIGYPHWSGDGRKLIFLAGTLENQKLYEVAADGRSEPRQVVEAGYNLEYFSLVAKTGLAAFTQSGDRCSLWRLSLASPAGPVTEVNRIAVSPTNPEDAAISPDGKSLLFVASATGERQVWVADASGANAKQVTSEPAVDGIRAIWLPDSSGLIASARSKAFGVRNFLFQPLTGPGREMPGVTGVPVSFSRDGRWLYFSSMQTGDVELYRYSRRTGELRPVMRGRRASVAVDSPDGQTLYFALPEEDRGLWKMPAGGGPAVQVLPKLARRTMFDIGPEGVYYMTKESREAVIRLRRFADGKDYDLHRTPSSPGWGFQLAPDRRSLIFSQYESDHSKILLLQKIP
jgi:Tol biopolymer transport system component/tRNA A-37 threonylcarbamoyl transferase component Bud32